MGIKISSLEFENVKRIKAIMLEPSQNGLTIIGGKNGQGKTSVLDTIAWVIGGNKFKPSEPHREGSVIPPSLRIVMDNGLKYSADDIAMAAVTQAVSSSLVENLCDIACEELKVQIKGEHRPRFSPGYSDFDISYQKEFFALLPVKEQLKVSLTESFMMFPTKTVTAFIGIK